MVIREEEKYPTEEVLANALYEGKVKIYRLADTFFKFVFGRQDREQLFISLVNSIVFPNGERAFTKATFRDSERAPDIQRGKGLRFDVIATLDDGEQANLEVQVRSDGCYVKRIVHYWSVLHGGQLSVGDEYDDIKKTISISILGFTLLHDEPSFRNGYSIRNDDSGSPLTDDLGVYFVEMPKYIEAMKSGRKPVNALEKWLYFLARKEGNDMTVYNDQPLIQEALNLERMFLQSKVDRLAYASEMKAITSQLTRERHVKKEAMKEGMEKGRTEGKLEMAKSLLAAGVPMEIIAQTSGLSVDDLRSLEA